MRKLILLFTATICCLAIYSQQFQLAPPLLHCSSAWFSKSTTVSLTFKEPGTSIHYTLNGTEPTIKSPVYKGPVTITKNTAFRARSFGKLFLPSPVVAMDFVKTGLPVQHISFTAPNEKYSSDKKNILHDAIAGIPKLNNGNWLGYNKDSVVITIDLKAKSKIKKLVLDLLQDQGSWIFLPETIKVYAFSETKNQFNLVVQQKSEYAANAPKQCMQVDLATQAINTKQLRVVLYPLKKIPDWHDGGGNTGWLFIDEINVY